MRAVIRDSRYRVVGYIDTDRDGRQRAMNARCETVGFYDPVRKVTKDAKCRVVGYGNVLSALLASFV
jgi:hypothetical protein